MAITYEVQAKDTKGKMIKKTITAENQVAARQQLKSANLAIVSIKQKAAAAAKKPKKARKDGPKPLATSKIGIMLEPKKVKLKDMTVFTRQFATMINAGVSMVRALSILTEQTESPALRRALMDVKDNVEQGQALSESFGRYSIIFDTLYCGMVKAGEAGGVLDAVLLRISGFLEAQNKLNQQVKSAMTYPTAVCVIALTISFGMLKFIVPMFAQQFEAMDAKLPEFTQFLVDVSNFLGKPEALSIPAVAYAAFWCFKKYRSTDKGERKTDELFLKLPVLGVLIRKVAVARFTRTLGTLLKSGVPLLGALEIVRDSIGNRVMADAMEAVKNAVSEGEGITKPLEKAEVFPPMVTQMIAIGEETGAVDAMLEKIADFYDDEVENAVKSLTSLLEPVMIVLLGGIVGGIIVGMYLPIFSIVDKIK
jgi:type IV pilus assembly protein PilC